MRPHPLTELDLDLMRESASPKCLTCRQFTRLPQTEALGRCKLGDCVVQDLGVCSAWVRDRSMSQPIEVRRVGKAPENGD